MGQGHSQLYKKGQIDMAMHSIKTVTVTLALALAFASIHCFYYKILFLKLKSLENKNFMKTMQKGWFFFVKKKTSTDFSFLSRTLNFQFVHNFLTHGYFCYLFCFLWLQNMYVLFFVTFQLKFNEFHFLHSVLNIIFFFVILFLHFFYQRYIIFFVL